MSYFRALWAGRTWGAYAYLLLGLPLGILWGVYTITMLAVGASLVIIWVGVPIIIGTLASMRPIGASERGLANALIRAGIQPPPPRKAAPGEDRAGALPHVWRWSHGVMRDGHAWRVAAWTLLRLVLGPLGFAIAIVGVVVPISLLGAIVTAAMYKLGWNDAWMGLDNATPAEIHVIDETTFWVLVGSPVLIAMMPMFAWASRGLAAAHAPLARWALGACEPELAAAATARAERAEEQVRIDQELHDSIGHMITMNIVQAGAGAHVFDTDPEFARRALQNIEERGRAAMGELDRIIATIRGDEAPKAPLPTIADIDQLVSTARRAGVEITSRIDAEGVPGALGRTAFAVVREALTNAARHAPGAPVAVVVARDGDDLGIAVVNGPPAPGTAPARTDPSGGHGVAGIRDRVTLLGGVAEIGPEDGGYAVRALVPLGTELGDGATDSPWARLRAKVSP